MSIIETRNLNLYYGEKQALKSIDMSINKNEVTALIGPSGCGKSTFLRTINRMNDLIDSVKIDGEVIYEGKDIYKDYDEIHLRKKIGMVFQSIISKYFKYTFNDKNIRRCYKSSEQKSKGSITRTWSY